MSYNLVEVNLSVESVDSGSSDNCNILLLTMGGTLKWLVSCQPLKVSNLFWILSVNIVDGGEDEEGWKSG